MREPGQNQRRRAALAGHMGDEPVARALLGDVDPGTRSAALGALARMSALTVGDLRDAVADPAAEVRRRAAEAVAASDPGPEVSLLGLLDDNDITVVEVAAWACGERDPAEGGAVAVLATIATSHDDALCREAAVAALGAIGDPAGLPAILTATADKATVRRRAVIALAPFEGDEVDAALRQALTDRDWQVRQAAEDLLA